MTDTNGPVMGFYYPDDGPHGLKHEIPYYARRPLPFGVMESWNAINGRISFQILIDTIGGQAWINVHKTEIKETET